MQLSRTKALAGKDMNTKYFHLISSISKSRKTLRFLKVEEIILKNHRCINNEVVKFLKSYTRMIDQSV